jgi:aminopeptidase N
VNTLRSEFTVDDHGGFSSFAVAQTAPPDHPTLRTHRLAVGLYADVDGRLERVHRVETDIAGERTEIPELLGRARPDLILVNDDDLTYAKVRVDPESLATMLDRIGDITDPLPRALCWATAWDMTRMGELPASSYVDLVLAAIDAEKEFVPFCGLLTNVEKALRHYCAPHRAGDGWARLADAAWRGMDRAERGGDRQLAWFHTFTRAAGGQPDRLRALYDGEITIAGLPLDLDARWRLLHALAAHGAAGEEDIAAELARDSTSAARRHTATARALRPTTDAKTDAWAIATGDGVGSAQTRMAYVEGFWHHAQTGLLEPYVPRFFAALDEFWTRYAGGFMAVELTYHLFPDLVARSTVAAADAWLARADTPPTQRRLVLERRDEIDRALRNRIRDA